MFSLNLYKVIKINFCKEKAPVNTDTITINIRKLSFGIYMFPSRLEYLLINFLVAKMTFVLELFPNILGLIKIDKVHNYIKFL